MNQTAIVTGAGRRIGRAIALGLAEHGWHVVVHCNRSEAEAQAVAEQIRAGGGRADVLAADLADLDAVQRLIPRCVELAGPPTCLVNNASLFLKDGVDTLTPESWQAHMDVNLRAGVPGAGFRSGAAGGRDGQYHQSHRPAGAKAGAELLQLCHQQVCPVVGDADHGAGARAECAGQRHRAGAGAAEHPP